MLAREFHAHDHVLDDLCAAHAELVLAMQRAGRDEGMDARRSGAIERARAGFDIPRMATGEGGDRRAAHLARNGVNGAEISG